MWFTRNAIMFNEINRKVTNYIRLCWWQSLDSTLVEKLSNGWLGIMYKNIKCSGASYLFILYYIAILCVAYLAPHAIRSLRVDKIFNIMSL